MKRKKVWNKTTEFLILLKREHKSLLWLLMVGAFTQALLPFVELSFYSATLNHIGEGDYQGAVQKIIFMLCSTLILGLITRACRQSYEVIAESCMDTMSLKTAGKAFSMSYEKFERTETMDAIRRVRNGEMSSGGINYQLYAIYSFVKSVFAMLFALFCILQIFSGINISSLALPLGGGCILTVIYMLLLSIMKRYYQKVAALSNEYSRKNERSNSQGFYLLGTIMGNGALDIRLYRMQQMLIKHFHKVVGATMKEYLNWGKQNGRIGVCSFLTQLMAGAAYFYIGIMALNGMIGIGDVLLYTGAITRLIQFFQEAMREYLDIAFRMEYLQIYEEFINSTDLDYDGTLPIEKRNDGHYEFTFEDVSFSYPDTEIPVLDHINLSFTVGKKYALVGRNGAGKTTLIKLLCRLYEPTSGRILLNGIDIKLYDYQEYVQAFSVVFQDFSLFAFPLGENISSGKEIEEQRIWNCLKEAGIEERVHQMSKEFHTILYKENGDGIEVSGGEAQKLAIARALYKDAPFIILDEPTAALDPISEAEIYENFNQIVKNKTAIYISHRMSSCKFCDTILVLDKGRIAECGSHEELLQKEGIYKELYQVQAQYYKEIL